LKVPNAALRYKPDLKPEELRQLYADAGITPPNTKGQGGQQGGEEQQRPPRPAGGGSSENGAQAQQQRREARGATDIAVIWKMLPTKKLEPVQVLKGEINEGDPLITGATKGQASRNAPGFGGPPRGR
jgi:hypothetical protein